MVTLILTNRRGEIVWKREETEDQHRLRMLEEKPVSRMNNAELAAEYRRRAAECGGCNQPPPED